MRQKDTGALHGADAQFAGGAAGAVGGAGHKGGESGAEKTKKAREDAGAKAGARAGNGEPSVYNDLPVHKAVATCRAPQIRLE